MNFLLSPIIAKFFLFFEYGLQLSQILLVLVVTRYYKLSMKIRINNSMVFPFYSLIITGIFGLYSTLIYTGYHTQFSATPSFRFTTQFISLIFMFLYCNILSQKLEPEDSSKIYRTIRIVSFVLVSFAYYEFLAKLSPLPDPVANLNGDRIALNSEDGKSLRLHSLMGEPRFLGTFLCIMFWTELFSKYRYRFALCCLYLPIIYYTKSTSAYLFFLILPIILTVFYTKSPLSGLKRLFIITCIIGSLFILFNDFIITRTVSRIGSEILTTGLENNAVKVIVPLALDAPDLTPTVFLQENPIFLITGVGYNMISNFVRPLLPYYGGYWGLGFTGVVEPNIGLLRTFASYGFIGFIIILRLCWNSKSLDNSQMTSLSIFLISSVILCITIGSAVFELMFLLALYATVNCRKNS